MAAETIRLLEADGTFAPNAAAQEYLPYFEKLTEADFRAFYRDMSVVRAFDVTATNLQRQGQLSLWVPSYGQEAAQIGSAHASQPQDHIFPSYREHGVGLVRGIDLMGIMALLRGTTHGGWNPEESNFHNYTLVIGTQTLHATGYAMGMKFDAEAAGVDNDSAVIVYFGDGATSQGDVHESLVFATSYQTPQLFFLQNNQWAISVPVSVQANAPLYQRALGYGMPSVQIDGNDVFASFAVTAKHLEDIRAGKGPAYIEALTYRMGAHTTTDDPTRYRTDDETASWARRDPIRRLEVYLRGLGTEQSFFDDVETEGADLSARIRTQTHELVNPGSEVIFDHVYTDPHPVTAAQKQWLADYEESFHDASTEAGA